MSTHISELRSELLATLKDLRNPKSPMEPDRARAVAQVAAVMVDTARVEVEYLKVTKQDTSSFIDSLKSPEAQTAIGNAPTATITHAGGTVDRSKPGVTRHTLGEE